MVAGFFKINFSIPNFLSIPLEKLGLVTYGVYLLHPIVYAAFKVINTKLHLTDKPLIVIALTSTITIVSSLAIYTVIEKPMIKLGKKITSKRTVSNQSLA